MKAFLTALVAILAISLAAWLTLENLGFSAAEVNSSPSVRLR